MSIIKYIQKCRSYPYCNKALLEYGCFPVSSAGKEIRLYCRRPQFNSWVGKIPWRKDKLPSPVFLGFPGSSDGKESACHAEGLGLIPGLGRSPRGGHGNPLLSWRFPWAKKSGGLHSMGLQKVRHNQATKHTEDAAFHPQPQEKHLSIYH